MAGNISGSPRRGAGDATAALFVRIPSEHARRLDRAAFELRVPKQELVSGLLERYVDPDSPRSLAMLAERANRAGERRGDQTITFIEPEGLTAGHHAFRPRELDVLTIEEAAELLRVEIDLVETMAAEGRLPGRRLAGEWRFARAGLLEWLAGSDHKDG
jgi:excisionase family DNA binding protein